MKKLGVVLAAGFLIAGCGVGTLPAKDSGPGSIVVAPTSSTISTPEYSVPVTTETPTSTPTIVDSPTPEAPKTTKAVAPQTAAAAKPKTAPKTTAVAAPPVQTECGADYYRNSSGVCVHRPSNNPAGATAICKDGSYSYSQHRSGTCSGHGGVRTWL